MINDFPVGEINQPLCVTTGPTQGVVEIFVESNLEPTANKSGLATEV